MDSFKQGEVDMGYGIWAAVFNFSAKLSCVLVMLDKYSRSKWSYKKQEKKIIFTVR